MQPTHEAHEAHDDGAAVRVYGVPFSAHTRKVLVGLRYKRIPFELRPLVPLAPDLPQAFLDASPLRKIPVALHEGRAITDSTVIALYLDRVSPSRPLYPAEPGLYAQALFIEELVDGALAESVLHGVLFQRVFGPAFLGHTPDEALVRTCLEERIPARLADLEARLDGDWFAGRFGQADITVASILVNLSYAGERVDAARFPRLHAFLPRALRQEPFMAHLQTEAPAARDVKGLDLGLLDELGL